MSLTMLCAFALLFAVAIGALPASVLVLAYRAKTPRWFFWGLVTGYALGTGVTAGIVFNIALSAWTE